MRASVGESDGIEYLGRITLCAFLREKLENADRAPVAQMDRVHASGAWGREFESHRARHFPKQRDECNEVPRGLEGYENSVAGRQRIAPECLPARTEQKGRHERSTIG